MTNDQDVLDLISPEFEKQITKNKYPTNEKLLVIYSDGSAVDFIVKKTLELKVKREHKFQYDKCGFHGFHENGHLQTLVGTQGKLNYYYNSEFKIKQVLGNQIHDKCRKITKVSIFCLGSKLPITSKGFNVDSSGVRIGNFFWVIGGANSCGKNELSGGLNPGKDNEFSYLWSIQKMKWIVGPNLLPNSDYIFHYTCSVALNSSAVLFIGISERVIEANGDHYNPNNVTYYDTNYKNNLVAIYNFDRNAWIIQQPINIDVANERSPVICSIHHGKFESK